MELRFRRQFRSGWHRQLRGAAGSSRSLPFASGLDARERFRDAPGVEPDHPDADEASYVAYPGFNPIEDMVDLTASVRSYQANLAVIDAVRQMINATIDVAR